VTDEAAPVGRIQHTHIGGQAVIEGIMMRGKHNWAVAVRTPDGAIHSEEHDLGSSAGRGAWMSKPVIRGVVALYDTLSLAMRALAVSASLAGETEEEKLSEKEVGGVMIFGVLLAVGLFMVLPHLVTTRLVGPIQENPFRWNLVDGLLRMVVLFGYIFAISRMKDVKRLFAYHGAEHKTIHAYEHGVPLEPESVQRYGTAHVRCGTSFLLMVMIVALVVYMFVPIRAMLAALGVENRYAIIVLSFFIRLAFLPVIAGLAYEVIRYAGKHSDTRFVKILLWPGMQLQRMTTAEPDDGMVEVAIAAVSPIIAREQAEEAGDTAGAPAPGIDAAVQPEEWIDA